MLLKIILQFIIGIGVGVYGYLMPSYINLGVMQLAMTTSKTFLRNILLIVSLVEIPYCFLCMSSIEWLVGKSYVLFYLRWLIVVVLFAMGITALVQALKKSSSEQTQMHSIDSSIHVRRLIVYAIFNPFQLSAWAIWGAYFVEKTWFSWTSFSILVFSLGAALGVFCILKMYAVAGQKMIQYFNTNKKQIECGIAILLILLGLFQLIRNIW